MKYFYIGEICGFLNLPHPSIKSLITYTLVFSIKLINSNQNTCQFFGIPRYNRDISTEFLSNVYFTSVDQQHYRCNLVQEFKSSKSARITEVYYKLHLIQAALCTLYSHIELSTPFYVHMAK